MKRYNKSASNTPIQETELVIDADEAVHLFLELEKQYQTFLSSIGDVVDAMTETTYEGFINESENARAHIIRTRFWLMKARKEQHAATETS